MKNEALLKILDSLKDQSGIVTEEIVVKFAEPSTSPLHGEFEWNDDVAGDKYRLLQAAELIHRVHVKMATQAGRDILVRAFVSLASDRVAGGGYRAMIDVIQNVSLHEELLRTALSELSNLQKRFNDLKELSPVFKAIVRATKKYSKKERPRPRA